MHAKKSFGQNFLYDENLVAKIVEAAGVNAGDLVLEVGPGRGILTRALLEAGAEVIAVELDNDLIPFLEEKFGDQIHLIHGDILENKTWARICKLIGRKTYKVVANIPYNITSPIIEKLFRVEPQPEYLVLMVQKEVADRILAKPPQTSVLSVACQLYAEGKKLLQVSRGSFRPVPKVDSTVIRLDLRDKFLGEVDPEEVLKITKAGFSARRKQLHGNLAKQKICSSEKAKEILKQLGLNEKSRAENLATENWVRFFKELSTPSQKQL
jgi:16S rRNA (adenine1518-N6/adenine1519-N6)-dimethyltransferase